MTSSTKRYKRYVEKNNDGGRLRRRTFIAPKNATLLPDVIILALRSCGPETLANVRMAIDRGNTFEPRLASSGSEYPIEIHSSGSMANDIGPKRIKLPKPKSYYEAESDMPSGLTRRRRYLWRLRQAGLVPIMIFCDDFEARFLRLNLYAVFRRLQGDWHREIPTDAHIRYGGARRAIIRAHQYEHVA